MKCKKCGGSKKIDGYGRGLTATYFPCPDCTGTGEVADGLSDKELKDIADKIYAFLMVPAMKDNDTTKIPLSFWNEVVDTINNIITSRVTTAVSAERERILKELPKDKNITAMTQYEVLALCYKIIKGGGVK